MKLPSRIAIVAVEHSPQFAAQDAAVAIAIVSGAAMVPNQNVATTSAVSAMKAIPEDLYKAAKVDGDGIAHVDVEPVGRAEVAV